ncbi:GTP-binding protein LepA [Flavobacteriaceae bacterium F89]|uniref:GTP-binding protein LepA n=1 Tax=Cerina litoralis TaxID=2874477 RepID=A0AAE3EVS9_9FLAO|nr:GTP-binding protein LepA [Cerina litoralis]MCG2461960.1 GTP-binding protein LepA [Cerina litoralis]
MTTYIAQFTATHRIVQLEQNSIFTWHQEGGEIDTVLLENKIKRESALHFYRLVAGEYYDVLQNDISVTIWKTMPL